MPGRALAQAEAPLLETAPPLVEALASPVLTAIVVSQDADTGPLAVLAREALPSESVIACTTAGEAISRADGARLFGRPAGLFVFDFRGKAVRDLAEQLRQVEKAHPEAELIVVADGRESATFPACLQVTRSPNRLTFLIAPLRRRDAMATIRTVAERHRALTLSKQALDRSQGAVGALEVQTRELRARLDIAMHAARHDSLTGVLNRIGFADELTVRLARSRQPQTVLLIDLDRFKSVNDTLGHEAGDDLVRKICTALLAAIPTSGVMARLGGDEFGIIVESTSDVGIVEFCAKLLRICGQSRRVSGHEVQVSASIGVAHQKGALSHVELMRHADLALNAAKREGRNRHRVYDTVIDNAARRRLSIESGLERAMNTSQLSMAYQPIVEAETGAIQGFEALIRWDSPEHGPISPADFVPVAEETGLILDLGDWITRQAFRDARKWNGPYVSVNLSARQFLRHNVAERILQYAADADVAPGRIQIELTETAIIENVERADQNLRILRAAGVRVALDDFGTGYSSLVYLNQFAIDCIKIDKSFVDNIARDHQSAVIVASVAKLAASLGMSVVAEGVETEEQRQLLIATGCGALQGFHFGRPMGAKEVGELLARRAGL
jgi:diguanylate cyclase (GGDEF)-like protein